MKRILIIPSAGRARRLSPLNNFFPKALIPCGDKPALGRILDFYKDILLHEVIIVVPAEQTTRFRKIVEHYAFRFPIKIIVQKNPLGVLDSIAQAKQEIAKADQVLVHLADTLLQKPLRERDLQESWVITGKVQDTKDWCIVKCEEKKLISLFDKPDASPYKEAICGVYFFHRVHILLNSLKYNFTFPKLIFGELQVSGLLEKYKIAQPISVKSRNDWHDVGNLERLHGNITFDSREHNNLSRRGQYLIKKIADDSKAESYYYRHVKNSHYFPQIFEVKEGRITMSYVPLQSLAYQFLYEEMEENNKRYIVDDLWLKMRVDFYNQIVSEDLERETHYMYGNRVSESVESLARNIAFPLKDRPDLMINNRTVLGWPKLKSLVTTKAKDLVKTKIIRHIHGDFHLANILYDPLRHIFVFVDPRGAWGKKKSIYGDIRYDFAKFLHSFHGGYEFIKNNLSHFKCRDDNSYTLKMPRDPLDTLALIKPHLEHWEIKTEDVLWLEGLCFLTMAKFYSDRYLQQQFFLQGIYLLNQLL